MLGRMASRSASRVTTATQDDTLIEGVVDLAFQESTAEFKGWTVIDFKPIAKSRGRKINTAPR